MPDRQTDLFDEDEDGGEGEDRRLERDLAGHRPRLLEGRDGRGRAGQVDDEQARRAHLLSVVC